MSGKYMPGDGEPVDMSELTLGPRYGSEDMYRDMGIERPSLEVPWVDTVTEVTVTVVAEGPLEPGPGTEALQAAARRALGQLPPGDVDV